MRASLSIPPLKSGDWESIDSNTMTSAPLGVSEIKASKFVVYPNPARQALNILLPETKNLSAYLELYSMDGRKYFELAINQPKVEIDVASLPSGMYFIRLISKEGTRMEKFVKE